MKEKASIEPEKVRHTVTIQMPRKTWELLEWICRFDNRNPRQQISYFLNILSGETIPTDTLTLELYRPLYGLFKRFKEKVKNPPSSVLGITAPKILEFFGGSGNCKGKNRLLKTLDLMDFRHEEARVLFFFGTNRSRICKIDTIGDILN